MLAQPKGESPNVSKALTVLLSTSYGLRVSISSLAYILSVI